MRDEKQDERDDLDVIDGRDGLSRAGAVRAEELMDAAWAALTTGHPREVRALEELLTRPMSKEPVSDGPVSEGAGARAEAIRMEPSTQPSMRRLELLLASTARNLRVLRGQVRMSEVGVGFPKNVNTEANL